jgi:phage tail sheath protein FI
VTVTLNEGPGVYIQELPSPVHSIVGVPTSVAGFVGFAERGVTDMPVGVTSWGDYERTFGGSSRKYPMSFAVWLFFLNGGTTAEIVRMVAPGSRPAEETLFGEFKLQALSPGKWGDGIVAETNSDNLKNAAGQLEAGRFNLVIRDTTTGVSESYAGVSTDSESPRFIAKALASSKLVSLVLPRAGVPVPAQPVALAAHEVTLKGGEDGTTTTPAGVGDEAKGTGIYALAKTDIFNMLCLPTDVRSPYRPSVLQTALGFCEAHRAMLLLDPPVGWGAGVEYEEVIKRFPIGETRSENAAIYFPNLTLADPASGVNFELGPAGAVAGVWAATDSSRGVWKAPAGESAAIIGIEDLAVHVTPGLSGKLNPIAVNCLRPLPLAGDVVWGARTTKGADAEANQWKYIPVRRTALFIEESLHRGTRWVVFEPNDESLWASVRLNVGAFMNSLYRQGAFSGTTPAESYLVKCDKDNNPPDQVAIGIVNILVGFAPLYPAEFVIVSIQQQTQSAQS